MRILLVFACFAFVNVAYCASYSWEANVRKVEIIYDDPAREDFQLDIRGYVMESDTAVVASLYDTIFAYLETGDVYLKQYDYTNMMVGHNGTWFIAYFGELISGETVENFMRIPLCDWYDDRHLDGLELDDSSDFYLGFRTNEEYEYDNIHRYGWMHLSIDDALKVSLLDSGVGLYGESVLVGIGPIPEPSACMLFVIGSLSLLLVRRKIKQV